MASLGIHASSTGVSALRATVTDFAGTGLLTNVNQAALNATGSGNTNGGISGNVGSVTSQPLGAASGLVIASSPYAALFAAGAGLLAIAASTLA